MYFPIYNFDKSTYRNYKDQNLQETMRSAKIANAMKYNMAEAEFKFFEDTTPFFSKVDDTIYIKGEDYYNYCEANNTQMQLPLESGDVAGLRPIPIIDDQIEDVFQNYELAVNMTSAAGYEKYKEIGGIEPEFVSPSIIDLRFFLEGFRVSANRTTIADKAGNPLDIDTALEWVGEVRNALQAESSGYLHYKKINAGEGSGSIYVNRLDTTNYNLGISTGSSFATYSNYYSAVGDKLVYNGDSLTRIKFVASPFERGIPEFSTIGIDARQYILNSPSYALTMDYFNSADIEVKLLRVVTAAISVYNDPTGDGNPGIYVIDLTTLDVMLKYLQDELGYYSSKLSEAAASIEDTPVGRILKSSGQNIRLLLDMDISSLNEMWITFIISNFDGINSMEDADQHTPIELLNGEGSKTGLLRVEPNWYKYVLPIIKKGETVTEFDEDSETTIQYDNWYVMGYVPDWKALERAPNITFGRVMQAMGPQIWTGVPKPETSAFAKVIAVVVAIVITVVTGFTTGLTTAQAVFAWAGVAAAWAGAAAVVTGSETWQKVSNVLGIVSFIGGLYNTVGNTVKQTATAMIKNYGVQIVATLILRVQTYTYGKNINKLKAARDAIVEEVDEIEELTSAYDKHRKVLKFIYEDHHQATYTINYDYEYKWNYLS